MPREPGKPEGTLTIPVEQAGGHGSASVPLVSVVMSVWGDTLQLLRLRKVLALSGWLLVGAGIAPSAGVAVQGQAAVCTDTGGRV